MEVKSDQFEAYSAPRDVASDSSLAAVSFAFVVAKFRAFP